MSDNTVIFVPPCQLAYIRVTGPYRRTSGPAWQRIIAWLETRGHALVDGVGYGLALDDPRSSAADTLRYDAGIKTPSTFSAQDLETVSLREFHGGAYFKSGHQGSYKKLGRAVSNARNVLLPHAGLMHDASRPVLTINYSYPGRTTPAAQRADICIPVLPDRRLMTRE